MRGVWTAAGVVAGVGATAVASYVGVTIATTQTIEKAIGR